MEHIIKRSQARIAAFQQIAGWWEELSPEGQAEYLKEHPDSKKALEVHQKRKDAQAKRPSIQSHEDHVDKEENPNLVKHDENHKKNAKDLHKDVQQFFKEGNDKPGSAPRKKLGSFIKKKSKLLIHKLKEQGEEWTHGAKAIGKLIHKGKDSLSEKERKHAKELVKDVIILSGYVAVGGGLAHGVIGAAVHFGHEKVFDAIMKAVAHAAVESARAQTAAAGKGKDKGDVKPSGGADNGKHDETLQKIIDAYADFLENGDIPKDAWMAAANDEETEHGDSYTNLIGVGKGKKDGEGEEDGDEDGADDEDVSDDSGDQEEEGDSEDDDSDTDDDDGTDADDGDADGEEDDSDTDDDEDEDDGTDDSGEDDESDAESDGSDEDGEDTDGDDDTDADDSDTDGDEEDVDEDEDEESDSEDSDEDDEDSDSGEDFGGDEEDDSDDDVGKRLDELGDRLDTILDALKVDPSGNFTQPKPEGDGEDEDEDSEDDDEDDSEDDDADEDEKPAPVKKGKGAPPPFAKKGKDKPKAKAKKGKNPFPKKEKAGDGSSGDPSGSDDVIDPKVDD